MPVVERINVPLNCPTCGGPLDIGCEVGSGNEPQSVRFVCPYCGTPRQFDAPGKVLWVAMRSAGDGPETRH